MPINNMTYTKGRPSKAKGQAEKAARDKQRFSQTRLTIKLSRDSVTVEHFSKKG